MTPCAAAAAAALKVENRVLLEQNVALRKSLSEVQAELRATRVDQLGTRARDGLNIPLCGTQNSASSGGSEMLHWLTVNTPRPISSPSAISTSASWRAENSRLLQAATDA